MYPINNFLVFTSDYKYLPNKELISLLTNSNILQVHKWKHLTESGSKGKLILQ